MPSQKLQVGCAGLGRMGRRHAMNFLTRTPRASLVAAFSPDEKELEWAREHLAPYGVTLYKDYDAMLKHEGLQAVVIATATVVHKEQTIKAINADKHVLCEKPLALSVEESQAVLDAARAKPHLKVMCGFSRRFDASYRDAWEKVKKGAVGRPTIIRSQTCDKYDPSGFFLSYASGCGGIFVDTSIHDIDLALWFLGGDSKIRSISAVGVTAIEPKLRKLGDRDNAVGMVEFYDGKIAYFFACRMNAAGQEDSTEIVGTKGKVTVNIYPQSNLVNIYDSTGIRREIPQTYYDRFRHAFVKEAEEFTAACLDNTDVPLRLEEAVYAVRIATALQEALISEKKIYFDQDGKRVEFAKL
ncbi:hypothetical protein VTO42DRAFT_7263 [Malbranchea cinnamomea]